MAGSSRRTRRSRRLSWASFAISGPAKAATTPPATPRLSARARWFGVTDSAARNRNCCATQLATPTPATPTHPRTRVPRCRSHATSEAPAAPTRPEAAMTTRRPRRDAHRAAGTPTTLRARNSNARERAERLAPRVRPPSPPRGRRRRAEPGRGRGLPEARERDVDPAPNARARGAGADARAIPERAATPGRGGEARASERGRAPRLNRARSKTRGNVQSTFSSRSVIGDRARLLRQLALLRG